MNQIKQIIKQTRKLRLLYVEDNPETMKSSLLILEEFFDKIIVAINGEDGLDKFNSNNIDIIITDVNMPILNGFEMIKKIRQIKNTIPIIITSAYNETEYFLESIKMSVDGYILKPINLKEFLGLLKKITNNISLKKKNLDYINILKQYQHTIDEMAIITKTDPNGYITYVSDSYCKVSGYQKKELLNHNHNIVRHKANKAKFYEEMWYTIKNKKEAWQGLVRNITKDGKTYYSKTIIKPILDSKNNIIEYIAIRNNITNLMDHKIQIMDLIKLSKLPVLVIINIELFKNIEIYYGQQFIKEIESKISNKIFKIIPSEFDFNRIFNLGNGDFAIAKDMKESEININNFIIKLKNFQNKLNNSYISFKDIKYSLSSKFSVAYGNNTFENAKYGLRNIKENKKSFIIANNLVEIEQKKAEREINTLRMIKDAIENFRVISYYQPIIDNKTMKINKYEALVRIIDKDNIIHLPSEFLEIAKKTVYYYKITSIMLMTSFEIIKRIKEDISINLSFFDIRNDEIRNKIFTIIEENKEYCHKVTFELLEEDEINDFDLIKNFIIKVKAYGIKIAIDDFGKGYSNFERLINYQPDIVKLDGILIENIENDPISLSIVEMMMIFAKKHNIKVIAEYVKNENIFKILKKLEIDYSQGFYLGKPIAL